MINKHFPLSSYPTNRCLYVFLVHLVAASVLPAATPTVPAFPPPTIVTATSVRSRRTTPKAASTPTLQPESERAAYSLGIGEGNKHHNMMALARLFRIFKAVCAMLLTCKIIALGVRRRGGGGSREFTGRSVPLFSVCFLHVRVGNATLIGTF